MKLHDCIRATLKQVSEAEGVDPALRGRAAVLVELMDEAPAAIPHRLQPTQRPAAPVQPSAVDDDEDLVEAELKAAANAATRRAHREDPREGITFDTVQGPLGAIVKIENGPTPGVAVLTFTLGGVSVGIREPNAPAVLNRNGICAKVAQMLKAEGPKPEGPMLAALKEIAA